MTKKPICHVCGKEKKPYTVIMNTDIFNMIRYKQAREKGEICERCDRYFAMTGKFKDATEEEFEDAKKSCEFARMMLAWWEKDCTEFSKEDKQNFIPYVAKDWEGIEPIRKWCREYLKSKRVKK